MKTKGKAWHLIATVLLIVVFVYTAFFGVYALSLIHISEPTRPY